MPTPEPPPHEDERVVEEGQDHYCHAQTDLDLVWEAIEALQAEVAALVDKVDATREIAAVLLRAARLSAPTDLLPLRNFLPRQSP